MTISKILASVSTVPTAPPKIILKRKEIQVSPAPAITESPISVPKFPNAQPTETEDFDMINESQDLPAIGDETSTEVSTSQTPPASSITAVEPQTRREPAGELMEDGDKQARIQDLASKDNREELLTQDETRSEPTEAMNLQVPTQTIANSSIQESSLKSEDSMDYEFIENLFHQQLREEADTRVSPKEVVVYLKLPIASSQLAVTQQDEGMNQPHLEDLNDVSYIIMSPTTPDKEDIIIDSESEKFNATASQLLLAHEEEVPFGVSQQSTLHTTIKAEEDGFGGDITLRDEQEEVWNFLNIIISCPGNKRQWEPEGVHADLMRDMIGERNNPAVTNEDCIAVVYNYAPDDDLSVPDEEYYRWCEPPTDKDELYRRYSFRRRRVDYFGRPAIYHNNKWYPEKYLPDPEDPEWSWKEGIEVPNYIPNYHPDWKGWRVSDPVMINLTNGRKTYMGEIRPDTSAPTFQPLMGQAG